MISAVGVLLAVSAHATRLDPHGAYAANPNKLNPPALNRLPAGAIRPEGWLKDVATLMADGLTGALPFWSGDYDNSKWIAGKTDGKSDEQGARVRA